MKFLLFIPMFFVSLSQPFSMSLVLTVQTMLTSLYIYFVKNIVWMALTLTLVMVGGLMISFVYVSSLIPAEPYTRAYTWLLPLVMIPFILMIFNSMYNIFSLELLEFSPINLFNSTTYGGTILVVGMLIMTLLMVCVNTLQMKSPMRSYS